MEIIDIKLDEFLAKEIDSIAESILGGKVVVLPTDTIYGLSALAEDKVAINKIYQIKNRSKNKPFVILVKSFCMLRKYCFLNKRQYDFIKEKIGEGRPLTLVLRARNSELNYLMSNEKCLAVRIPFGSKFLISLMKKINKPIVSTSLNLSGEKEIIDLSGLSDFPGSKKIDLAVNGGAIGNRKSSMIVDIVNIDKIKVLRK